MKPLIKTIPICLVILFASSTWISGQSTRIITGGGNMPPMPPGMTPPPSPSSPPSPPASGLPGKEGGPWVPSERLNPAASGTNDQIQISFQGANIDMVVQWLAQTTGKTVIKHPQVQCQLTITSSKKVSTREAINIVYRALGLEGFSIVESSRSILIVPEGKEPRMSPELLAGSDAIPEGRQRLAKVFTLKHVQAVDLKEKVRAALSDKASIDMDERANQLIITDFNDNIRVVGELIAALDSDRPEDVAVRVIALKHVGALDLAKEVTPLYQKMNTKTPKDTIDVAADDRSNALIVLSSEANFNAIEKLVSLLDTEDAQEKALETFLLKNADAQDVAKQLQELGQNQTVSSRYVYVLNGNNSDNNSKKLSVVADRRRNAVIVQAPPAQMDGIRKMIRELDEPVRDDSLAPRIYHMKYVSAVDIEDVLNELFLKKQQQRSYWDYYYGDSDSSSTTEDRDVGRLYGKVRITSEPYSNTLIVTANSKENLAVVEDVLNQLDTPSEAGESTLRVEMRFAKASIVARNMNILFAKNGSPPLRPVAQQTQQGTGNGQQQQQNTTTSQTGFDLVQDSKEEGYYPWLGGQADLLRSSDSRNNSRPVSDLVGRVRFVADERANSVLVSANVHFFPQILKLINDLDAPSDQVMIEARIVEVSSDFLDKLGVRWSPDGTQVFTADDFDNSFLVHGGGQYQKGFGGNTTVNTPAATPNVGQMIASLRSGVIDSTISVDYLVQFLRKTTDATVLGDPQITIRDNETGKLFVGQQVPIPDNTQVSQLGGQNTTIRYKDVGVVLEVTPHINNSGDVELKIHAESSTVVPGQIVLGGAVFDTRNFRTELTSKNGQTLVLGGIIQKQISDTLRKTPILGDIPGLGWAFKKRDKITHEVELMVFLHPRVIRSPGDANDYLQELNKRVPRMKKWELDSQQPSKPK